METTTGKKRELTDILVYLYFLAFMLGLGYEFKIIPKDFLLNTFNSSGRGDNDNNAFMSQKTDAPKTQDNNTVHKTSYDAKTIYNTGVEDYTKSLQGGVTPSVTEEKAMFDTRFPDGTDAEFKNYQSGCQHAFWEWKANGH